MLTKLGKLKIKVDFSGVAHLQPKELIEAKFPGHCVLEMITMSKFGIFFSYFFPSRLQFLNKKA